MKVFLLILTVLLGTAPWTRGQPAQIIVIRHAEKPSDPNAIHLSKEGEKRAKELAPFLTTDPASTKYGLPVALYAAHATKHGHGLRTQETITPLAKELHMPIQTPYLAEQYAELARSILSNRSYQGKTVVVCWVHEYIPRFAVALGIRPEPPKWKGEVYDRVYLISFEGGKASLQNLPQVLSASGTKSGAARP